MAYGPEVRSSVRTNFIHGNDLKGAATLFGVSYETARNWKRDDKERGDDWDKAKAAYRLSNSDLDAMTAAIIERFVFLFETTISQIEEDDKITPLEKAEAISRLSDAYQKTVKAAKSSSRELSALSVALDVLKRLAQFIEEKFPQYKEPFVEVLAPFGKELTRTYE
jgi:hypothetical protein